MPSKVPTKILFRKHFVVVRLNLIGSSVDPVQLLDMILYWQHFMDVSTSSTYIQLQNANEILCWMIQLTQHIQLQNTNEDFK